MARKSEFEAFDTTMRKILSVSREDLKKPEKEWKQKKKKRAKASPACPDSSDKA
jgi:hypothetical protein